MNDDCQTSGYDPDAISELRSQSADGGAGEGEIKRELLTADYADDTDK